LGVWKSESAKLNQIKEVIPSSRKSLKLLEKSTYTIYDKSKIAALFPSRKCFLIIPSVGVSRDSYLPFGNATLDNLKKKAMYAPELSLSAGYISRKGIGISLMADYRNAHFEDGTDMVTFSWASAGVAFSAMETFRKGKGIINLSIGLGYCMLRESFSFSDSGRYYSPTANGIGKYVNVSVGSYYYLFKHTYLGFNIMTYIAGTSFSDNPFLGHQDDVSRLSLNLSLLVQLKKDSK